MIGQGSFIGKNDQILSVKFLTFYQHFCKANNFNYLEL